MHAKEVYNLCTYEFEDGRLYSYEEAVFVTSISLQDISASSQ